MMQVGLDNLVFPSEEAIEQVLKNADSESVNMGGGKKWRAGELEFEAEMRVLDNAVSIVLWTQIEVIKKSLTYITVGSLVADLFADLIFWSEE